MSIDARRLALAQERAECLRKVREDTAQALAQTDEAAAQAGPGAFFYGPSQFFLKAQLSAIDAQVVTTTVAIVGAKTAASGPLAAIEALRQAVAAATPTLPPRAWLWSVIIGRAEACASAGTRGATCHRTPRRPLRPAPSTPALVGVRRRHRLTTAPTPHHARGVSQGEDPSPLMRPVGPRGPVAWASPWGFST